MKRYHPPRLPLAATMVLATALASRAAAQIPDKSTNLQELTTPPGATAPPSPSPR